MQILISVVVVLIVLSVLAAYYAYYTAFGRDPKREAGPYDTLPGEQYEKYKPVMDSNVDDVFEAGWEEVSITSRDGIRLHGRYFHHRDGGPVTILFHGYRSNGIRDVNGAFRVCRRNDWNVLTVDQRAHGESEGKSISFGIKERFDCIDWVNYAISRFGKDVKITIMGVSMGAATVLMAAGTDGLPSNVKGVAADCPYANAGDMIRIVIRKMKLPEKPAYFFVKLGARLFGKFDIEQADTLSFVRNIRIPVLIIHGRNDNLIPWQMSQDMHNACTAEKMLVLVDEADHGMSYYLDNYTYEAELTSFFADVTKDEE